MIKKEYEGRNKNRKIKKDSSRHSPRNLSIMTEVENKRKEGDDLSGDLKSN